MTSLEKIKQLIQKGNIEIFIGMPVNNWQDMYVGLSIAESPNTRHFLGDMVGAKYRYIRIDVYCTNYLDGFNLMEEIKTKIDDAEKSTMKIVHVKDLNSSRDTSLSKHVISTLYKEII